MPAKSAKQYGLMAATLGGAETGVSRAVAKEFVKKTPKNKRKKFTESLRRGK